MQDLDNPLYTMLSGVPGRYIQIWRYSDGIQLDFRTDEVNNLMVTPMFEDASAPFTSDVRQGFIFADTVQFTGQFAFREGIFDSVYINPEVELTLESPVRTLRRISTRATSLHPVKSSRTPSPVACLTSTSQHRCSPTNTPTRTG